MKLSKLIQLVLCCIVIIAFTMGTISSVRHGRPAFTFILFLNVIIMSVITYRIYIEDNEE